jgi:peptidoglycan/LPS O-acetylase OafA/YrhL
VTASIEPVAATRGEATPGDPGRLPALDGLRGVAILMVLLFHTTFVRSGSVAEAVLHGLFRNFGWCGVDLFFVLSGFLITGILWEAKGGSHYFRNFYARRVLRILPVYYGYVLLLFLIAPRVSARALDVGDDAVFYWIYLQNFATAAAGDWVHSRFLNLFWSLAVEEHFYLVWPWVVLALRRRRLMALCGALALGSLGLRVALSAAGVAPVAIYVLTPTRLDGLAVGALLALAARGEGGVARLVRPARAAAAASGAGLLVLVAWQRGFSFLLPGTLTLGLGLLALFFGAILVLALGASAEGRVSRALSSRALRAFGRYSYALYVIHQAVFVVSAWVLANYVFEPLFPAASLLALQLAVYALALGLAFLLAAASWRFYEEPLLRLKRFFPTRPLAGALTQAREVGRSSSD